VGRDGPGGLKIPGEYKHPTLHSMPMVTILLQ